MHAVLDADALRARAVVLRALRRWFDRRGYLEVHTPVLVPSGAMEENLETLAADGGVLHTSPEFAMKRVLGAGLGRIYQITPCFRGEESGPHHHREFTLLEWYRAGAALTDLMDEVEDLIGSCAQALGHPRRRSPRPGRWPHRRPRRPGRVVPGVGGPGQPTLTAHHRLRVPGLAGCARAGRGHDGPALRGLPGGLGPNARRGQDPDTIAARWHAGSARGSPRGGTPTWIRASSTPPACPGAPASPQDRPVGHGPPWGRRHPPRAGV